MPIKLHGKISRNKRDHGAWQTCNAEPALDADSEAK